MFNRSLFINLAEKAYAYNCKANEYRKKGELEGALINYLLSTNNLSMLKKANVKSDELKTLYEKKDDCEFGKNIDEAIKKNIKWIVPLQNKLRKIKKNRSIKNKLEDNDEIDCSNIKMSILKRGECLTFNDIAGQETAKEQIKKGILYPILNPGLFPISSKGILFYGPPGTGKTLLAKAFVNELQLEANRKNKDIRILFYAPTGASLKGKFVGETEKNISKYFKCASKQATLCENAIKKEDGYYYMQKLDESGSPIYFKNNKGILEPIMEAVIHNGKKVSEKKTIAVLFIDEIEAIAGSRGDDESGMMTNSVNTLLQMMDGVASYKNVVVMGATNYPWKLDDAILRRFDSKILVTLPKKKDIVKLIKIQISMYIDKAIKIKKNKIRKIKKTICNSNNCDQQNSNNSKTKDLLDKYSLEYKNSNNDKRKKFLENQIKKLEKMYNASLNHSKENDKINIKNYGYPYNTNMPITDGNINKKLNTKTHIVNNKYSGNITSSVCCGSSDPSEKICLNFPCLEIANNPKPIDKFEFYRKNYFPHLKDSDLSFIASLYSYEEKPFSGGDVANACKAVFKKMGDKALQINKWYPYFIENANFIIDNNLKNIKSKETMKSQDAYQKNQYGDKFQYLLYSPYGNGKNYQNLLDETYLFMPTSKYFKSNETKINIEFNKNRYKDLDLDKCSIKTSDFRKKIRVSEFNNKIKPNDFVWSQDTESLIWKLVKVTSANIDNINSRPIKFAKNGDTVKFEDHGDIPLYLNISPFSLVGYGKFPAYWNSTYNPNKNYYLFNKNVIYNTIP